MPWMKLLAQFPTPTIATRTFSSPEEAPSACAPLMVPLPGSMLMWSGS
jgi:hypothetical protein